MAHWISVGFGELSSRSVARGEISTSPNLRLHVTGGETMVAAPVVTDISVDAICSTAELDALRSLLAYGDTGALDLQTERIEFCQLMRISNPRNVYNSDTWTCTLDFEQVGEVVNPVMRVHVGNTVIADVVGFSVSLGRISKVSRATIRCATPHGRRGDQVLIHGNVNFGVDYLFAGVLETVSDEYFPGEWTLECFGKYRRMARSWPNTEEYTGQTAAAMIVNMVEKRGLPAHSIQGTGWVLGTVRPVLLRPGDTFSQWIDTLDEIDGYATYENDAGVIVRRDHDPVATGTPRWTVQEGVDIKAFRRNEDLQGIRNHVIVTGLAYDAVEIGAEASDTSAALDAIMRETTGINFNAYPINSPLIETNAHAATVAARALARRNRVWQSLEITIPFMPSMLVDEFVRVLVPSKGIDAVCQIWDVKHDFDGEGGDTTIVTNTGNLPEVL